MNKNNQNYIIDLHIHTKYSDGTHSAAELLDLVKSNGVNIFSVTDHDSVGFYNALSTSDCSLSKNLVLVPGVELTCRYNHAIRDILGYGIDVRIIQEWLDKNYSFDNRLKKQRYIVSRLKDIFSKHDIKFDAKIDAFEGKKSEAYIAMLTNASCYPENIEKLPDLSNISTFYVNHYSRPESEFYVDEACDSPTIPEAIELIHRAGGKAFIAHPYKYKMSNREVIEMVEIAVNAGADGMELKHSSNKGNDVKNILEMAKKYNLLISGGTDFHGDIKPDVKLATGFKNNVNVEYTEIAPWIESIDHW